MSTAKNLRQLVVPTYLFLCIVLGGSAQAIWGNLTLQLLALALLGWAAAGRRGQVQTARFRTLAIIGIAGVSLVALQLIPLPPDVWTRFPGRDVLAEGYSDMSERLPWLPASMAPTQTLSCALYLLPPFAVVVAVDVLHACRVRWAVAAILSATVLSVLLGYVQVSSASARWYLYEDTNLGSAVGFFANRNHMGTLLLMSIPFTALFLSEAAGADRRTSMAVWLAGVSCGVVVLAGIAMNGSLAALLLTLPVTTASFLLFPSTRRLRTAAIIASVCALTIALALLANSPVQGKLSGAETSSITGRWEIWTVSLRAAAAAFPIGTGFGSFVQVYHLFENPWKVTDTYVIHAHNDYIELLLEGGVPVLLILVAFILWWARAARDAWGRIGGKAARAATVACAAVLCHSMFDYPLRTEAIAAVFAFSLSLMADPSRRMLAVEGDSGGAALGGDLRPARHRIIG